MIHSHRRYFKPAIVWGSAQGYLTTRTAAAGNFLHT